jgi:hypothetical protein
VRVKAFCAKSFRVSVHKAAGIEPITCPPVDLLSFRSSILGPCDFLYLKLHGLPEQGFWYGDRGVTACSRFQVASCHLEGAVVFAANCFLPESPMLAALFDAGASAVIAGSGINFARPITLASADIIGAGLRRGLAAGLSPGAALNLAKAALVVMPGRAKRDALAFRVYERAPMPARNCQL